MAPCKTWQVRCVLCAGLLLAAALIWLCISLFVPRECARGHFAHAAVSADSLRCSEIGRDILQQGGSAVDGAIASLLCTSLVNPQSMGLGGGSIFTIRDKTGKVRVFSSRETVPLSFKPDLLNDCPTTFKLVPGIQWTGVPGELRGYEEVHRRYGKLPWAKLFEPTIKLAREGFPLPPFLEHLLTNPIIRDLVKGSSLCELFCNNNKTVLSKGDTLKFPKLAETMEIVAEQGAFAFYKGKIGSDLIEDIKAAGGTITMEDLRTFRLRMGDAWTIPIGDSLLHIPPPPAGGATLALILNLMKGFNLSAKSIEGDQKIQTYHRYVEALKFANGQKGSIKDPQYTDTTTAAHLIDSHYADRIRERISPDRTHNNSYYNVKPSSDHYGTTHVSVLAEDGSAVSVTSTINQIFGASVYSPRTGILLNNELIDFCGRAASLRPGEQPPSSMAPALLESKSGDIIVIGGSGGSMITTAMASSLINHLWLGKSLGDAIAAPVVFVDAKNNLKFEPGFEGYVIDGLKALGHKVEDFEYFFNVVNAVAKENRCITAVSDRRKMGQAAGY
ncbi:glutathione hydrolase 5 proenzyme isoform X2 [Lampris incognitus]|uniref:glutathione hydrolase 5 proenzyme isoform X2 n=1 Tax=Lampris incognitus TaxID=2546036 RepID=UPI0024B4D45B|nr:glutathione hydrolase 5 proenzyme isoform X2 [Lampris incognitus]